MSARMEVCKRCGQGVMRPIYSIPSQPGARPKPRYECTNPICGAHGSVRCPGCKAEGKDADGYPFQRSQDGFLYQCPHGHTFDAE